MFHWTVCRAAGPGYRFDELYARPLDDCRLRQPLVDSRAQIRDGIAAILPYASERGVKLAVEPLHPMYADSRSAINTMRQANDMCDRIDSPPARTSVRISGKPVAVAGR